MTTPNFDLALASLDMWGVEVELGGQVFHVPPLPASEWFVAILSNEAWPIIPGMCSDEEAERLFDMVLLGEVRDAEVVRANRDALSEVAGWRWWEAERLIVSVAAFWKQLGGLLLSQGVKLNDSSLGAVLATVYSLAAINMKPEDKIAFDAQISAPPMGYRDADPAEWFAASGAADSFAELVRSVQGG